MTESKILTEKEYRALEIDSYSSIKVFIEDRKKYHKKYILKEKIKDEDSDEIRLGSLSDCLQFTAELYEERYALAVTQIPTGQYGKFVEELWKITKANIGTDGRVSRSMESMMEDAYTAVKYNREGEVVDFKRDSFETAKTKFFGTNIETYYLQLRESHGKCVIELSELEAAQAVVTRLKSDPITRDIINQKTDSTHTVYCQFPIVGEMSAEITKSEPYKLKCLIDKMIIDHEKKMIFIYDLKVTWDNEKNFKYSYLKYKYYIQMAIYFYLVVEWKKRIPEITDYAVVFPKFIVAESNNYKSPLIYITGMENFDQGMKGFMLNGEYHPGVIKAIQDLIWHKEAGVWTISKENHQSNGLVKMKIFS